ncbi:MAG: 50S ribosomal protein L21 [Anaerolineae bacterium]|nr:50S ribosomal protein L21 [Anaerolineae bacterium]
MYAVVRVGGRQYRVETGSIIDVERMPNVVDDKLALNDVLLVADGDATVIGQPTVSGASVAATVVAQFRAAKVIVFKYRQRTKFRRKRGHRHYYTRLRIDGISV